MLYGIMMDRAEMFMVIPTGFLLHFRAFRLMIRQNPKNGMVIDFTDLKNIVKKEIINVFDHAVTVSANYDKEEMELFKKHVW